MPTFCVVLNSSNDKSKRKVLPFCRVPKVIKNQGEEMEIFWTERRRRWLSAIFIKMESPNEGNHAREYRRNGQREVTESKRTWRCLLNVYLILWQWTISKTSQKMCQKTWETPAITQTDRQASVIFLCSNPCLTFWINHVLLNFNLLIDKLIFLHGHRHLPVTSNVILLKC
jgi:hypothetical protein